MKINNEKTKILVNLGYLANTNTMGTRLRWTPREENERKKHENQFSKKLHVKG
jgi:hypothetical protein